MIVETFFIAEPQKYNITPLIFVSVQLIPYHYILTMFFFLLWGDAVQKSLRPRRLKLDLESGRNLTYF